MVMITTGGPNSPAKAAMPPAMPRNREPNTIVRLTILGPGRKWHSAKVSLNSSAVIQRCCSPRARLANTSPPPNPASDILAKATNSAIRLGGVDARLSGAATAADEESGGMGDGVERLTASGQPIFDVSTYALNPDRCFPELFGEIRTGLQLRPDRLSSRESVLTSLKDAIAA